ncbi:MAG: DNA polymerase III subunit beta [Candidatus Xenobiia bacterium LiM19]
MRTTVSKKELEHAVSITSRAISLKSPLPILSHFLIKAETGKLTISATDLELGIECTVKAQVMEEGAFTTPAKTFQEIINLLPDEDLLLTIEGEELHITSSRSNFTLMTLSADEFPLIPRISEVPDFIITQKTLKELIRHVNFAAAKQEETRAILTGVLIVLKDNTVEFIATDGRRLAKMKETVERSSQVSQDEPMRFVIPSRTLDELVKFLKDPDDKVSVSKKGGQVLFEMSGLFVLSRILDGKYPGFEQVVPLSPDKKVKIDRHQILIAVKRALVMARDKMNPQLIRMKVQKDRIILKSNTPDMGSAFEEVPASLEGGEVEIAFNGEYFCDVLTMLVENTIVFELTESEMPSIIKPFSRENYTYVVMPVRLREQIVED